MQQDIISFTFTPYSNTRDPLPAERCQHCAVTVSINGIEMSSIGGYDVYSVLNVGPLSQEDKMHVGTLESPPKSEDERVIRSTDCTEYCCPSLRTRVVIGPETVRWFGLRNPFSRSGGIEDADDLQVGWQSEYLFQKAQYLEAVRKALLDLHSWGEIKLTQPEGSNWQRCQTMVARWLAATDEALLDCPTY